MLAGLSAALRNALFMVGVAYLIAIIAIAFAICIAIFFLFRALLQYFIFRRARAVCCPETKLRAIVRIDSLRAALTSFLDDPVLEVSACSLWPERLNCDRGCLGGLAAGRHVRIHLPIANRPSANT
jgi:hypothetical protein